MVNNLKACILAVENGEFKKLLHSPTEEKIKEGQAEEGLGKFQNLLEIVLPWPGLGDKKF